MFTMESLLRNNEYWDVAYERLISKRTLSKKERHTLTEAYTNERDSIIERIIHGEYKWSIPKKLEISKHESNKKRVVYVYEIGDRLVLGVMYRVFSECYKERISDNCYSYKTGVGANKAVSIIKEYRPESNKYGVKLDIHAYFNSVSDYRIQEMIDEMFDDGDNLGVKKCINELMTDKRCIYNGKETCENKGLIPGNPLASFFANYCLRECDEYFDLTESMYARYSDDIILVCNTQDEIDKGISIIKQCVSEYGLEINKDKYQYFGPGDEITFLGLKIMKNGKIDMSDHLKTKVKKQIHRWCRKGRLEIEIDKKDFMKVATRINNRLNNKNFKCYIRDEALFGWCHYIFRYITTDESLKEIDQYTKDTLRAMKTGCHNKANINAISEDEFRSMNWVSLVQLYHIYKKDFEYYCEVISII